jgi:serine/threonine protein kinase/tetratricopeptide (TPR) repeat protein
LTAATHETATYPNKAEPVRLCGRKLGEYVLGNEIGRGGMGAVFEAIQAGLERRVAVKVLRGAATISEKAIRRFHREAEAIARLHHPNIIPVYSVGEQDGIHYYAMELVDGVSLEQVIAKMRSGSAGRIDPFDPRTYSTRSADPAAPAEAPAEPRARRVRTRRSHGSLVLDRHYVNTAVEVIAQAADALQHAHERKIVHRDVKPSNLLLAGPGKVVLSDFGLAHQEGVQSLTRTGDLFGTPMYMSPEQAMAGRADIDHRTDIYSLGATLYELLTLEPPCESTEPHSIFHEVIYREPRSFRRLNVRLPRDLEVITFKAMEKKPERRYQTAQELGDDLRRFLNYQAIHARPPGMLTRLGKFLRRHRAQVVLAGAAAVAAIVLAVVVTWHNHRILAGRVTDLAGQGFAELEQVRAAGNEAEAAQHFDLARESFGSALALDDRDERAADGLLELYLTRSRQALVHGDYAAAGGMLLPLKQMDRRQTHTAEIALLERQALGTGTWKLDTVPSGSKVRLARLDEDCRPGPFQDQGTSPLPERDLPMGSYLVELSHPDFAKVRYPLFVGRNEARDLHIPLVRREEIPRGMVYVPAGEFLYGDPEAATVRKIHLDGFFIDRTEVIGAEYEQFVKKTGARPPDSWEGSTTCPPELRSCAVYNVSWFEAMEYAHWAGKRLPTELEWEKAARGADGRRFPWGNRFDSRRCTWHDTPAGESTLVVGRWRRGASPYDCLDMAGNVWEWTADRERPLRAERILRGGASPSYPSELAAYRRQGAPPAGSRHGALNLLGFRCVRSLKPRPAPALLDVLQYRSDCVQAILVYGDQDRPDRALACAERILQINPDSLAGHTWRSICLEKLKRPAEALEDLKFVYLRTPDPDLRERANELLTQVERAGKKVDRRFLAAADGLLKARQAFQDRRFPEAEALFKKVVELDPHHPIAQAFLGDICTATGRPEEAARHYEETFHGFRQTIKEDPGVVVPYREFALFLAQRKLRLEEGLTLAERAVEVEPDDPACQATLAELLYRSQRVAEAIAHAQQAVDLALNKQPYRDQLLRYQKSLAK